MHAIILAIFTPSNEDTNKRLASLVSQNDDYVNQFKFANENHKDWIYFEECMFICLSDEL